jgi:hypothetical protein
LIADSPNIGNVVPTAILHGLDVIFCANVAISPIAARGDVSPGSIANRARGRAVAQSPPFCGSVLSAVLLHSLQPNLRSGIAAVHAAVTRIEPRAAAQGANQFRRHVVDIGDRLYTHYELAYELNLMLFKLRSSGINSVSRVNAAQSDWTAGQ